MREGFKLLVKSDGLKAPSASNVWFDLPAEEEGIILCHINIDLSRFQRLFLC